MGLKYYRQLCLLFIVLWTSNASFAQNGTGLSFSNLRYKTIAISKDSVQIDSLSVAQHSFFIDSVAASDYDFFPERSLLVWKRRPLQDSVHTHYRVLPLAFYHRYSHKSNKLIDSNVLSMIYRRDEQGTGSFVDFNQLDYNGSYARSISIGNNQDVVLNSNFNLQVNGYILDSVKLEAALTDNTIPFQPEGNTQRLQEFDQIYIRLTKQRHYLQLGDYNLDSPPGYFLKFGKRVQGVYYQTGFDIGKRTSNKLGLSGSVAKGQFARNIFQGQEGNQGPYKLTGNNGEQFFIILAGTERVYVDNVRMERGENADYVMNYNTGEIRFMPRKMITKDSRIQVEFEYQDRNYLNSLIYAWDELQVGNKWNIRFNAYSNQDAKNQPYLQNLTGDQKNFLSGIGDSIQSAYYPSIAMDTFAANKILYKIIDTTVNGISYDSVFVYSTNADSAQYSLGFSFVGNNKGNYIISATNANGRVYDWVAPVNGVPQGSYEPVQLLITPKKQQVFILTGNYKIDTLKNLNIELGASNTDPNLFSKKDNPSHWGMAARIHYTETRLLGKKDTTGKRVWNVKNNISYEFVQDRFYAIAPYRNVEFNRDWNIPQTPVKPDEHLLNFQSTVGHRILGTLNYSFFYFQRGGIYRGYKNVLGYDYVYKRVKAGFVGNLLKSTDTLQRSAFFRPAVYAEYNIKELMNASIGGRYEQEDNQWRDKKTDTLLPAAFSFDITSVYLRTPDQQPIHWGLTYFVRRDKVGRGKDFRLNSHSDNIELKFGFNKRKDHIINFTGTYRKLSIDDTALTTQKPEESLLGRLEYSGSFIRHVASVNTLYEFGSGQEQKKSYTYVEVPAGQGVYTWNDYNGDGVQQANEFEIAIYQDQKRFIKVFTPTNEYVKVNYMNFNFSLMLEPSNFWQNKQPNRLQQLISRISTQTSLQTANRLLADNSLSVYNPFVSVLNDTAIITTSTSLSNSIYFNRSNTKWGIDYNVLYNTGKQLLVYGVEGNTSTQHLYKIRWNVNPPVTIMLTAKNGIRNYISALQDNRTYSVNNWSGEPSVTWLYKSALRVTAFIRYEERHNKEIYGGEDAIIQSASLDFRFSRPTVGVIQLRGTYSNIDFNGVMTSPVSFIMLDALQPGNNYLWYMNWERRVGKGIELSLEYEGRKPGTGNIVHTGRMSIKAIL